MKRLLKSTNPPSEAHHSDKKKSSGKYDFTFIDLVDILKQLEEIKTVEISAKVEDGLLYLKLGDNIYEVSEIRDRHYPRRRLRKLET